MQSPDNVPARRSPAAWAVFLLTAAIGLTADLWSKAAVFAWVLRQDPNGRPPRATVLPDVMHFTLSVNPGIAFGVESLPPLFVTIASLVAVAVVIYFFATSPRRAYFLYVGLGMICAGALGNLYDRLFGDVQLPGQPRALGHVRDFIDFNPIYRWIFNVADVLLVVGVAMLMISWLRLAALERRAQQAQAQAGSAPRKAPARDHP